jgi:hypothetical protein
VFRTWKNLMNYFESELEKYYLIDMAGMALWSDEN